MNLPNLPQPRGRPSKFTIRACSSFQAHCKEWNNLFLLLLQTLCKRGKKHWEGPPLNSSLKIHKIKEWIYCPFFSLERNYEIGKRPAGETGIKLHTPLKSFAKVSFHKVEAWWSGLLMKKYVNNFSTKTHRLRHICPQVGWRRLYFWATFCPKK